MVYAYVRVSTKNQNTIRQIDALTPFNIQKKNIFIDKESGSNFNRTNYQRLIKRLKEDDLVIIKSIDRLGRNYNQIIEEWQRITKTIKADIKVLDMPLLDTRQTASNLMGKFISDIVLQILSFVSENERLNIKARQAEGIRLAKANGVKFGRPKKEMPENFDDIIKQFDKGIIDAKEGAQLLNISKTYFYKLLREIKKKE